jgi:hypothetical protein
MGLGVNMAVAIADVSDKGLGLILNASVPASQRGLGGTISSRLQQASSTR